MDVHDSLMKCVLGHAIPWQSLDKQQPWLHGYTDVCEDWVCGRLVGLGHSSVSISLHDMRLSWN